MTAASWDFSRFNVIEWRFSISAHCQWGKRGDVDGARTDGLGNVGCPFGGGELVFPVWITLLLASFQLTWLAKARVAREEKEEEESGVAFQSDRSHFNKTQLESMK